MDSQTVVAKDKLITDFKAVMANAEALLHATANQAGEKVTVARGRGQGKAAVGARRAGSRKNDCDEPDPG